MSVKVRFTFCAVASPADSRTTVVHVITIQVSGQELVHAFPQEFRDLSFHASLLELPAAKLAKRDLKPRWARRSFNVTLCEKLVPLYFDADENPVFNGKMLDEYDYSDLASTSSASLPPPLCSNKDDSSVLGAHQIKSLASVTKNAVISKFGSKSLLSNADSWLTLFESECRRLQIEEDRYWEVIRLFLEEGAEKWYCTTRLSNPSTSWNFWKTSFLENFGSKGLTAARAAWTYHYINGSMSDYAQNKLNLLVSYNPKMSELDKMTHLVLGLPRNLQDKVDFSESSTLGKLLSKINTLDLPRSDHARNNSSSYSQSKSFCPYCKKKGFDRPHAEKDCLTKACDERYCRSGTSHSSNGVNNNTYNSNNNFKDNVKSIHSFNFEDLKSEIDSITKNE